MPLKLDNEKATDVLIWWVEGADGSIDYDEERAVKRALKDLNYSLETYYGETLLHIGALGTEKLKELVDKAIQWGAEHFDTHRKKRTVALLETIATANGAMSDEQREKIDAIKRAFDI